MTIVTVTICNYTDEPLYLQVDPWAGIYLLKQKQWIEIIAESETASPSFMITETKKTRVLTINDSDEYYVVVDGERLHYSDYQSNIES